MLVPVPALLHSQETGVKPQLLCVLRLATTAPQAYLDSEMGWHCLLPRRRVVLSTVGTNVNGELYVMMDLV